MNFRILPRAFVIAALAGPWAPGGARTAAAADLTASVASVTVAPGSTVDVPISVSPGPTGLGILGIQVRLELGAAIVQSSTFVNADGWLWTWGAPARNANASFAAAAAAGVTPVASADPRLATVRVTVRSDAPLGTDLPLTLSTMNFNEGTPSVTVANGVLRVRAGGLDATSPVARGLALAVPSPNPARRAMRVGFTLPEGDASAQLDVRGIDGRRVRTLVDERLPSGTHERSWDLRDDSGRRAPPGLYFVTLRVAGASRTQRVVVNR